MKTIKARKPTKKDIAWWKEHGEEEIELAYKEEESLRKAGLLKR